MEDRLKIYVCGSMAGGRQDAERYVAIVNHLKTYGTVLNEIVASPLVTAQDYIPPDKEFALHKTICEQIFSADVIIAEGTQPSIGVGYEIGRAVEHNIKTLVLYRPDNEAGIVLSALLGGHPRSEIYQVRPYVDKDLLQTIDQFMAEYILLENVKR